MNRKLLLSVACGILGAVASRASVLTVQIEQLETGREFSINNRPMPLSDMLDKLGELARLDSSHQMFVMVGDNVTAATLVEVLGGIQEAGLRNLVLITAGERKGDRGMYSITVDVSQRKYRACVGEFESGFEKDRAPGQDGIPPGKPPVPAAQKPK